MAGSCSRTMRDVAFPTVERFGGVFEQATVGMVVVDLTGQILRANECFARMLGYSPAELIHCSLADMTHPSDLPTDGISQLCHAATTGRPIAPQEMRYAKKDGTFLWVSLNVSLIRDRTGTLRHVLCIAEDATQRKVLEERLRESEQRATDRAKQLEATLAAVVDGVVICDAEGRIIQANPGLRALLDAPDDFDLASTRPDDRLRLLQVRDLQGRPLRGDEMPTARTLAGERLLGRSSFDHRLRTFRSREIEVSVTGAPLADTAGKITGAVAVLRDVTERRQLEREANKLAQLLDVTFDAMNDALLVYDRTGQVVRANKAVLTLFGIQNGRTFGSLSMEERARALPARDVDGREIPSNNRPGPRLLRGEVLRGDSGADELIQTLDGREVWTSCSGSPIRDANGEITGAVLVVRDVTERRRLDRRTRDALAAIVETANILVLPPNDGRNVDDSSVLADHLARCVGRVLDQKAATSIALLRVDDEMTTTLLATVGLPPPVTEALRQIVDGAVIQQHFPDPAGQSRLRGGLPFELDLTRPPYERASQLFGCARALIVPLRVGERLTGILTLNPYQSDYRYTRSEIELAAAVGQLMAIVFERSRLRREREEAVTRLRSLEETQRRMDEFLGIASHELRTPLTSIKASLQLTTVHIGAILAALRDDSGVADGTEHDEETGELIERLDRAHRLLARGDRHVNRLAGLVSDMLDVSRIQKGGLALRLSRCDLATVVREFVDDQLVATPGRTIRIHDELDRPAFVTADPDRISQVLHNYVSNALKYSRPDQPIHLILSTSNGWARAGVRDEGPGLHLDQQKQVWDRFYRAEGVTIQSGSGVGLGLGLFISRGIIQRHGGCVGVDSRPGLGSTFWFSLPLVDPGIL